MTNSTSVSSPRPTLIISQVIDFLAGLLLTLQAGVTLILGYVLHITYLNSAVYRQQAYVNPSIIMIGRDPLPHQLLAILMMLFALNAGWIIRRLLAARDTTTDPELLSLHRQRRRRYAWLALHAVFTGLIQFVTVAMRDVPEMKWDDSGSHIRYPLTWMPFAVVLVTLMLHLARAVYVEVLERYNQRYTLNKRKYHASEPDEGALFTDDLQEPLYQPEGYAHPAVMAKDQRHRKPS
ncbi:MAG: hypothetical protein H7X77_02750 [Anaerolineae bacterium]|nr:hypothetical protein [Anaerolineae bacterium]